MSQSPKPPSTAYTYTFMIALCFGCALVLSVLASVLRTPQEEAKKLDRSKQMLMSASILSSDGYFLLEGPDGTPVPAKHTSDGRLVPGSASDTPSSEDILAVFQKRILPILVTQSGEVTTFAKADVDMDTYLDNNAKDGYAALDLKLAYEILPNPTEEQVEGAVDGYIFPVTGFGLWDRIYGYIAIKPDGDEVINVAWYQHMETPGLGANIASPSWQAQFPGKHLFERSPDGVSDPSVSPLGINVRRGKVVDELGDTPKAMSAVDGMAGATLTGVGVSKAYKDSLEPYRPFLISLSDSSNKNY